MKTCARERCPPTSVLKAMLAKGSVKFGLGMQLGRMEGAKEARAWPRTPRRTTPLSLATPLSSATHTRPSCSAPIKGAKDARYPRPARASHTAAQPTHSAASCLRGSPWDRSRCRVEARAERGVDTDFPRGPTGSTAANARYCAPGLTTNQEESVVTES